MGIYKKLDFINKKYLPACGEGETMATQICTAINKLIYKWYNDGDVFDNTYLLCGWVNDLSSYANWLYKYVPKSQNILDRIKTISYAAEYNSLLEDLASILFDQKTMEYYDTQKKTGSIYKCDGNFKFVEAFDDEDDF